MDTSNRTTVIAPKSAFGFPDIVRTWQVRELIAVLAWRNIRVRYKQSVLGFLWAILVPFASMVIFSLIFGKLADMPSDGFPYPIFVYAGLLPWHMFAKGFAEVSGSIEMSGTLIKRTPIPRLVFPLSNALPSAVDFGMSLAVLAGLMFYFDVPMTLRMLAIPLVAAAIVFVSFSFGIWIAVASVTYRDLKNVLPFLIQIWFFATPVIYPSSLVEPPWDLAVFLNPMAAIVGGMRWAVLGTDLPSLASVAFSAGVLAVVCILGLVVFRYFERIIPDRL